MVLCSRQNFGLETEKPELKKGITKTFKDIEMQACHSRELSVLNESVGFILLLSWFHFVITLKQGSSSLKPTLS